MLSVVYLHGHMIGLIGPIAPAVVNPAWTIKAVGDYNADGAVDLIFQHANGALYAWFMNGAAMFSGSYLTPAAVNPAWQLVGPR